MVCASFDLRKRVAQREVQPSHQDQGPVAQGGMGQRIGNREFHFLLALGAPIAMNRVLGDFRFQLLRNVFGISGSRFLTPGEPVVASRTSIGARAFCDDG